MSQLRLSGGFIPRVRDNGRFNALPPRGCVGAASAVTTGMMPAGSGTSVATLSGNALLNAGTVAHTRRDPRYDEGVAGQK